MGHLVGLISSDRQSVNIQLAVIFAVPNERDLFSVWGKCWISHSAGEKSDGTVRTLRAATFSDLLDGSV
jgi:hypothetical protein